MKKIVHDITTIINWNGRFVGIARAESEFAKYLSNNYTDEFQFVMFSKFSKKFYTVPKVDVLIQIEKISKGNKTIENTNLNNKQSNKDDIKRIVLKIVSYLPNGLNDLAYIQLKKTRKLYLYLNHKVFLSRNKLRIIKDKIRKSFIKTKKVQKYQEYLLTKNDIYVSLGLDWDDKNFEYIYKIKNEIGFKTVLFCYDLIPIKMPHLCVMTTVNPFSRYFVTLLWAADLVLCISKNSRKDLLEFAEINSAPKRESRVITLGSNIDSDKLLRSNNNISEKYILFVSTIEARKNHDAIYKALVRLSMNGVKNIPKVKFVGMLGWGVSDLFNFISNDPYVKSHIEVLHNVSENDLIKLYKNCLFTVFPSYYEGWGLPVAESLTFGKFCLCSNSTSIPEVGKDFVEYIDPYDIKEWSERINYYYNNQEALEKKEKYIKENYKPDSWNSFGKEFIRFIKENLNTK